MGKECIQYGSLFYCGAGGRSLRFFVNSQLVNQNVFFFIFWLNQKLIPLFRSEKKGRITDHFRTLLCEILYNVSAIVFTNQNFIKIGKQFFIFLLVFFRRKIFTDTCSIAAFLFPLFYKIKEIGGIKIGKLVIQIWSLPAI